MKFVDAFEWRHYYSRQLLTLIVDSLKDRKLDAHTIDVRTVYSRTAAGADKKECPEEENIKQVLKGSFQSSMFYHSGIAQYLASYRH